MRHSPRLLHLIRAAAVGSAVAVAPFTQRSSFNSNYSADLVVSAPGTYQSAGTNTSSSEWIMILSAFRGF